MSPRTVFQSIICCLMLAGTLPAHALTQEELVAKLKAAGYSQIGQMKSTPEGNVVKATKNGKEVTLSVDSNGQIKERQ